jgi:hypothetical protein
MELRYHWKEKTKERRDKYKWDIEKREIVRVVPSCLRSEKYDDHLHIHLREYDADIGGHESRECVSDEVIAISSIELCCNPSKVSLIVPCIREIE